MCNSYNTYNSSVDIIFLYLYFYIFKFQGFEIDYKKSKQANITKFGMSTMLTNRIRFIKKKN